MTIHIFDNEDLLEINFQDIQKFHGTKAYAEVGVAYRMAEAAFEALYGKAVPVREDLSIVAGQACTGFRDAFEYITRAETRGKYVVDASYPMAQYDPHHSASFAVVFSRESGEEVEVSLKKEFLPPVYFEYLKKSRDKTFTVEEEEQFELLKKELCMQALQLPLDDVVEVR